MPICKVCQMKHVTALLRAAFLVAIAVTGCRSTRSLPAGAILLVKDNQPSAAFVVASDLPAKVHGDLKTFNDELERSTGCRLPVGRRAAPGLNRVVIRVEEMPWARDDGFEIAFPEAGTMRITGSERSVWWALMHILEKHGRITYLLGGNRSNRTWVDYPAAATLRVPAREVRSMPSLPIERRFSGSGGINHIEFRQFHYGKTSPAAGSHNIALDIFPAKKYAPDKWPEAILPTIGGKKLFPKGAYTKENVRSGVFSAWSPCFSQQATVDIAVENVLERLRADPSVKCIGLNFGDNGHMCECADCTNACGGRRNSLGYRDYSEPYWKWANGVAARVAGEHPDVIFMGSAYREQTAPPPFRLHENICPALCFESLAVHLNDDVAAKRWKLVDEWSRKSAMFGFHDYYPGVYQVVIPKPCFRWQADFYGKMHAKGLRAAGPEMCDFTSLDGPRQRFNDALFRDITTDPDAFMENWCAVAVGPEAGRHLCEFYRFWEDYWTRPELKQTNWYSHVHSIYMPLGDISCTLALRKGDLDHCHALLEMVVALADTPERKVRAEEIIGDFRICRDILTAVFAGIVRPNGSLENAANAVELLRAVPDANGALKRALAVKTLRLHGGSEVKSSLMRHLSLVTPFLDDAGVKTELAELAADRTLTKEVRAQTMIWLGNGELVNLVPNGSLEDVATASEVVNHKYGTLSQDHSFTGSRSMMINPPQMWIDFGVFPVSPGKTYMFSCRAFIPEGKGEERLRFLVTPRRAAGLNAKYWTFPARRYSSGMWQLVNITFTIPDDRMDIRLNRPDLRIDHCRVRLLPECFEHDGKLYIDDVQVYCLDDLAD
jgi:hypothetical protein